MKRLSVLIPALVLAFSLAACGESAPASSDPVFVPASEPAASAPASSAPAASPLPEDAPESIPYAPVILPGPYAAAQLTGVTGTRYLYQEPRKDSAILAQLPTGSVVKISEKDGWAQCVCGTLVGWTPVSGLAEQEELPAEPIPYFLTEEQQLLYAKALSLFNAYSRDLAGQKGFVNIGNVVQVDDVFWGCPDLLYGSANELFAALSEVFTADFVDTGFVLDPDSMDFILRERDGVLYLSSFDRGSWGADVTGFTPIEVTDERVTFSIGLHFGTAQDWDCTQTMELVRTENGWRFADFTSSRDDGRWIPAMGPDFDVWAAIGEE